MFVSCSQWTDDLVVHPIGSPRLDKGAGTSAKPMARRVPSKAQRNSPELSAHTGKEPSSFGCGSKIGTQHGTLVNGNVHQNLRFHGGFMLTHTHFNSAENCCHSRWSLTATETQGKQRTERLVDQLASQRLLGWVEPQCRVASPSGVQISHFRVQEGSLLYKL